MARRRTVWKSVFCYFLPAAAAAAALSGCARQQAPALPAPPPDMTVYTCQESEVCRPIIKEFEERTGMRVQVTSGTSRDLQEKIDSGTLNEDFDVVFGVNSATLDSSRDCWEPYTSASDANIMEHFSSPDHLWTGFSALPLVIMYNTKVVTYRELPDSWASLLEPRWNGRIAFMDPEASDTYSAALVTAMYASPDPPAYLEQFAANLNYRTLSTIPEVNAAIAEGRCSLGVTLEEMAENLRRDGAEVDYIYPDEGTCALPDGSAVVAGCAHPEAARRFIDFTVSTDVQRILVSDLNRRSVRSDVPPMAGLEAIGQISLIPSDSAGFSEKQQAALKQWRALLAEQEERGR